MKNTILFFVFLFATQLLMAQYCGNSGSGVCTPSGTAITTGFSPSSKLLPTLVNGQSSFTVLEFENFDSLTFIPLSILVTVQALKFDSINNLPQGLCWATNQPNNTFANQQSGCIRIVGTTCADPGVYRLSIKVTATVVGLGDFPVDGEDMGLRYFLRVKNSGDADIVLDTTQTAPFNKPAGYSVSANCNIQYGVNLGANQTVCNGSVATLNPVVAAGTPPFTFSWSATGDVLSCTTCQNPLATITQNSVYSVTVIDANNHTVSDTVSYAISGGTNTMQLGLTSAGIDCANPQDLTIVTVTGGASPFDFNWGDGSTTTNSVSPQQHNFTHGANYVIAVTDNNGCVSSALNTVAFNGIAVTAVQTVRPNCENMNTGKLKVVASGGTAPYTFNWSNGATTDSLVNIVAGNYWVTVTDVTSCSSVEYFNLSPVSGWGLYAYLNCTLPNCSSNGSINAQVHNGIPPYSFNWSNGATTQIISGLAPGGFVVTITDSIGCVATATTNLPTTCRSIINGIIYSDTNSNCLFDAGENLIAGLTVSAERNGQMYYANTNSNGAYAIEVPSVGTYTLQAYNYSNNNSCGTLSLCGNPNQTTTIATLGDTSSNNNFGLVGSAGFDLSLFMSCTSGNPGFQKTYKLLPYNNSQTILNGLATLTFSYDSNLIYQSSNQTVMHNLANHTLTWLVDSLDYSYWGFFTGNEIDATFLVPLNLSLTYYLQNDFAITPTVGDCDSSNNQFHTNDLVTGSFDPNEKRVEPAGKILEGDSILTYTIGFQNTGTDSTHFIIVKDTLSPSLNAATVRNIASSHPYSEFTISGQGILTWVFNPLRLVDSFTNEPGSHGFVKFTVKKKNNMPVGSIISNTAHIYFDYNTPVVTNTVADTISEPNFISPVRSDDGLSVKAFPNPFGHSTNILVNGLQGNFDFELYDVTGRLRNKFSSIETNQFILQRDELSSGIYFYRITSMNKKQSGFGKLVVE